MKRIIANQGQLQLEWRFAKRRSNATTRDPSIVALDSFLPVEEVDLLATRESFNKHLFRPNTYLHKWWARRSGTTFRYLLKQLVPELSRRDYYAAGGLEGITLLD